MMKKLRTRFKLWLNTKEAEGVFGDGKWQLLRAIESERSLRAASQKLSISYRKAWGDLKKAEHGLKMTLVKKQRGGRLGGRTCLTENGKKWVKAYSKFHREIKKAAEKAYEKHIRKLV